MTLSSLAQVLVLALSKSPALRIYGPELLTRTAWDSRDRGESFYLFLTDNWRTSVCCALSISRLGRVPWYAAHIKFQETIFIILCPDSPLAWLSSLRSPINGPAMMNKISRDKWMFWFIKERLICESLAWAGHNNSCNPDDNLGWWHVNNGPRDGGVSPHSWARLILRQHNQAFWLRHLPSPNIVFIFYS